MCKVPFTIKHIFLNCESFRQTCPKYYLTGNLEDLFKNTKPVDILSFLKETNLFIEIWSNKIKYNKTHTVNPKSHTKKTKPI